jgi:3-hydroxyisobutyrate dehydrogenase-like beta-hydroxyacid dehydrogenase
VFGAHVHHMGGSGSGHVTKVLNNFLNGVTLAATAEVMVAGRKAGLDLAQLLEVINTSTGSASPRSAGSRTSSGATTWRAASPGG